MRATCLSAFLFSSRIRHTRCLSDWSSDVCSSDLTKPSKDEYASGMVHFSESEFELTPTLDRWQFELLKPYLGRKILEVGAGAGRITADRKSTRLNSSH